MKMQPLTPEEHGPLFASSAFQAVSQGAVSEYLYPEASDLANMHPELIKIHPEMDL